MKKTLLLILSLCFLLSPCAPCTAPVSAADNGGAWELLTALGIFGADEGYTAGKEIKRGEFVRLLIKAGGYGYLVEGETDEAYIKAAAGLGLAVGYEDGSFRPDAPIICNDALVALVKLLGFSVMAEHKGGYAQGYYSTARSLGLTDGISAAADAPLTWGDAAIMFENTMNADLLGESYSGNEMNRVTDETLLTDRFSIYQTEAVIDANEYSDLMSAADNLKSGYVTAGGAEYSVGGTNAADCLGMNMKLYYRDDGDERTLLYIKPYKNRVLELDAGDFDALAENRRSIEYDAGGRSKKASLASSVYFLYNGKMAELTAEKLDIEDGRITLISNDGDSIYDVIAVTSCKSYVVSGVVKSKFTVNTNQGVQLELDPDKCYAIIEKDGAPTAFDDIKEDTVISYAESENIGTVIKKAVLSDKTVSGKVTAISGENNTVTVDDAEYKATAEAIKSLSVGREGKFYLSAYGRIVYFSGSQDIVYGYLERIWVDDFSEDIGCRIFTENDRWVELMLCDKVKFNGKSLPGEDVLALIKDGGEDYKQLIRYRVNDEGRVNLIQTAKEIEPGTAADKAAIDSEAFRISAKGTANYRATPKSFNGVVGVGADAKIFAIPPAENGVIPREKYAVLGIDGLFQDASYSYIAYDANEVRESSVFVIKDYSKSLNTSGAIASMMVVDKVGKMVNADGDVVEKIVGFWGSEKPYSLPVSLGDRSPVKSAADLKRGDIIQFTSSDSGEIDYIEKKYFAGTEFSMTGNFYSTVGFVAGRVLASGTDDKKAVLQYDAGGSSAQYSLAGTDIYVCETDPMSVRVGDISDLQKGDRIFGSVRYLVFKELYIIRN